MNIYQNPQYADIRDNILFNTNYIPKLYVGGIRRFHNVPASAIQILADAQLLDEEEAQNNMPSIKQILKFCAQNHREDWYVDGYAVSYDRDDCCVSVDALGSFVPVDGKTAKRFKKFFKDADTLEAEENEQAYCWFD